MKEVAVSIAEGRSWKGIRWNILVSLFMKTRIHVKPSESGKSVIKSIEIEDQGRSLI